MSENENSIFLSGELLAENARRLTAGETGEYKQRDFVKPLYKYCTDNLFNGNIGIVYGLRSTGKTVGILQTVKMLIENGYKAAYARFNYEESGMYEVNAEMKTLIAKGYTHFFLDEATYLENFLNKSAEWPDTLTPSHKVKIIVSGTDSFLLLVASGTSLLHRYKWFSTNWISYGEYARVTGNTYDEYKMRGGKFTSDEMEMYVQSAVVENLLHTIKMVEESNRANYYTERLFGLSNTVIIKAVLSIFKCTVQDYIIENFAEHASQKNIADMGDALEVLKRETGINKTPELKERVANSIELYRNFTEVKNPVDVIEALIAFLVRIGCLFETATAVTDIGTQNKAYCFANNALMNYAIEETIQGIINLQRKNSPEYISGVRQAAEDKINESIVMAHVLNTSAINESTSDSEKVFKYRDEKQREIDVVVVYRKAKTVRLIEVKSAEKLDEVRIFNKAAAHLYDDEILENIGVDDSFKITREIVYRGETKEFKHAKSDLKLWEIEDFLCSL
ncbi:hypothetical protein FACS1894105_06790 [Clostridia bacterium]|nr:hypothetical protein FACS1894105_06790 [Clostridia bacterium]